MRSRNLNFSLIFHLVFLCVFISNVLKANSEEFLTDSLFGPENPCENKNCGQGTCFATNASLLGFDCQCNPGWSKIQLGPVILPTCTLPNCTLDFQCGNGAPPPPPPPPPTLDPTNPCGLVWCGEGTCVVNGTGGYYCQCFDGSTNFLNLTGAACFKRCSLGADCNGVRLGQYPPPPPPSSSGSPGNGLFVLIRQDTTKSPAAAPPPENTPASGTNSTKTEAAEPPSNDSGRMGMGLGLVAGLGLFYMGLLSWT